MFPLLPCDGAAVPPVPGLGVRGPVPPLPPPGRRPAAAPGQAGGGEDDLTGPRPLPTLHPADGAGARPLPGGHAGHRRPRAGHQRRAPGGGAARRHPAPLPGVPRAARLGGLHRAVPRVRRAAVRRVCRRGLARSPRRGV